MDNYFKWFGICTNPTKIKPYGLSEQLITLNSGDLIKISPQSMPNNSHDSIEEIRLILLYNEPKAAITEGRNDDIFLCSEKNLAIVEDNLWPYLVNEANPMVRLTIFNNRENLLSLKIGEMINIYMDVQNTETKICCQIEYIGEVPEYGKGVYFCLRAQNFGFVKNPQTYFIEKYARGPGTNLIIVTASAFFEVIDFREIVNRPFFLKEETPSRNKSDSGLKSLQKQWDELKMHITKGNSSNDQPNIMEVKQLQFNSMSLACSTCHKDCPISTGILLANCGHVFCYDCLSNHVNSSPEDIHICPFINKNYKCHSIIQLYEVEGLNSNETKELINKNRNANVRSPVKTYAWDCNHCTFENNLKSKECEMCRQPRVYQSLDLIQCMNCFDNCKQSKIFMLPECKHNVCNNCLMVYIEYQLKGDVDIVVCPIKFCDYVLKSQDILDMFIQLDRFYIKNRLNLFDVCVACQVSHSNSTCKQFQKNLTTNRDKGNIRLKAKYDELVVTKEAAICPKCGLVVIKQGCEKEYCFTCEIVFESGSPSKTWQCGICCNSNERATGICGVCGKSSKNKGGNKISSVNCMFCTSEVKFSDGVVLNCSHFFCKICLESLVLLNQSVLKCPYEQNNKKCLDQIEEYEVLQIMGAQMYKRHKVRLIRDVAKQTENSVLCLDENCAGWTLKDDLYDSDMFICTVCRKPSCLKCKVVHAGMTCAVYKDPVKREQFLKPKPKQYDEMVKMDDDEVITNNEPFECPICYLDFDVGEAVVLRECLHTFCKPCLTNHVKHTDGVEAKCPFKNDKYKCDSIILEREIKAVADKKTYEQYIERWYTIGKNNIENGVQCLTVNCNGFWENDGNINEQECPLCKAINCLNCKAIHPDMKCDEYQTSNVTKQKLEDEIAKGIGMRCPKCKIIIVRSSGCDWLQCAMCRTEICWVTKGARWGPNGRGDISGGCRCRANGGQLCHPKCMNCH